MLSKENYDKLDANFLYQNKPTKNDEYTYWCKNWTFKVQKLDDGRAIMIDTFYSSWDSNPIWVTNQNIDEFKVIFDFREVVKICDSDVNEYNEEDLYYAATGSGGYSCGGCYWIKKGTPKSLNLQIAKAEREVDKCESALRWAKANLERLLEKKSNEKNT
jgi:hypothetical protein